MQARKGDMQFEVLDAPFWGAFNDGTWEPETFEIFNRYLDKEHSYLDIGAWIGPTVLYGSKLAKHVYAFEPDEVACAVLKQNINLNEISNVSITDEAVDETSGERMLGMQSAYGDSMSSFLWTAESKPVKAVSLASVLMAHPDCNFIKMDIEGGEQRVLRGAAHWLKRAGFPTLYLSLHTPWIADKAHFLNEITDLLSLYDRLFDAKGRQIQLSDIRQDAGFRAIVATNVI